ncbi:UvrD-helicase domain-containing protein, partial [Absicoccus porci]
MPFTEAQKKAIDLRGANILVSASAGSGKTSVLVERLCQLVTHDKISINHILAMTFTNDAASEMKERLRQELLKQEQTSYIRDQLALLETAQICTIDSFCLSLVQNYYYQIPISLKMANAIASDAQKQQAFDQAFQHAKESLSLPHLNDYIWAMHIKDNDLQKALKDTIAIAWAKPD